MSARNRTRGTRERDAGFDDEPPAPPVVDLSGEDDVAQEVMDIIEGLGGDEVAPRVQIEKQNPKTEQWEFLPSMGREFSIDALGNEYGGGRYRVRVYHGKKYVWGKTFGIADVVRPRVRDNPPTTPTTPVTTGDPTLTAILNKLIDKIETLQKPTTDPMKDGLAIAKQLVEFSAALGGGRAGGGIDDDLARAEKLANLAKTLGGGGGGHDDDDSDTVKVLKAAKEIGLPVIDTLKEAISLKREELARSRPTASAPAAAAAPAAPATPETTADLGVQPVWIQELSRFLPQAIADAQSGAPAISFAAFMLDRMTDDTYDHVVDFAEKPDAAESLVKLVPALAPHRAWVDDLLASVRQIAKEAEDAAPQN